jgi:hypothetical protein
VKIYVLITHRSGDKPVATVHADKESAKTAAATDAGAGLEWKKAPSTNTVWAKTYDGTYRITEHDVPGATAPAPAAGGSVDMSAVTAALDALKAALVKG